MGNFRFTDVGQRISLDLEAATNTRLTNASGMASYLSTVDKSVDFAGNDGSLPGEFAGMGPSAAGEISIIAAGVNFREPNLASIARYTDRMNDTIGEDGEYNRLDGAGDARSVVFMKFRSIDSLVSAMLKTAAIAEAAGVDRSVFMGGAPSTIVIASDDEGKGILIDRLADVDTSWNTLSIDDQRVWGSHGYNEDSWNDSTNGNATAENLVVNLLAGGNFSKLSHISMSPQFP